MSIGENHNKDDIFPTWEKVTRGHLGAEGNLDHPPCQGPGLVGLIAKVPDVDPCQRANNSGMPNQQRKPRNGVRKLRP